MNRIEDVEGTEQGRRPRRRGRWRRCGTWGAWGSAQASCRKAVTLVEDGAVAEDAEYGARAEDDAGVETVSEAGAARGTLQSERWC